MPISGSRPERWDEKVQSVAQHPVLLFEVILKCGQDWQPMLPSSTGLGPFSVKVREGLF